MRIEKLSDDFGQYELSLKCAACGHMRRASPHTLAHLCGWEAQISAVAKRLRCSKCGAKKCTAEAVPLMKPRGLKDTRN
jgi:hypothetical protein